MGLTRLSRLPLVVALVAAGAVAACGAASITPTPSSAVAVASQPVLLSPTPSVAPSPSPSPSPQPTAKPSSKPAPWETYKSTKYHYTISHPPFWAVRPGRHSEPDMFDHSGYPFVYVSRDVDPTPLTLSETVAWDIAWYKSHYHAKVVTNRAIKVAGYNGRLITYRGLDGAVRVVIESLQLVKGRVSYDLSMIGLAIDADSNASIFKRMYTSFKPT
jgi:hypothetical protein